MAYVLHFREIDKAKLPMVGGKGANLGELSRIDGIRVPEGFCVTTEAYKRIIGGHNTTLDSLLDQLAHLKLDDREQIREISGKIRKTIEQIVIPTDIHDEITSSLSELGETHAYAVRSSATAEDLPNASFAGQHDTYLNVRGRDAILHHISTCWASLFTDRAVTYRIQNGFDHRKVYLSVVIQRMIFPQASGIMFTADPVTANRKVLTVDASFGLGEALVSGLVNADIYKVRDGKIIDKKISTKERAIYALHEGGTEEREIEPKQQDVQTLTDEQILQLERLGRKIESYFGCPQDIEWCLCEDAFFVVQSRPITTLYPIPELGDEKNHVFVSVGHAQNMTDAIRPLGISMLQFIYDRFSSVSVLQAGGRLYLDITHDMASPLGRTIAISSLGQNDPLTRDALMNITKRKNFMQSLPHGKKALSLGGTISLPLLVQMIKIYSKNDVNVIQNLMVRNEASVRELQKRIASVSGEELFPFIAQDQKQLQEIMYNPASMGAVLVTLYAASWINRMMKKWLGEKNAADTLSQSVDNNVASEMGLALLDVSDVVRRYPAAVQYFHHFDDETFFEDLIKLEGGEAVIRSLQAYLEKYGMRGSGEFDITRTRWGEQPTALIPMILNNIRNFQPNAHSVKFAQGKLEAEQKEHELLSRLKQLPRGKGKVKKARKMISRMRNFAGYREYPKYALTQRYYIYKQALLREAGELAQQNVIREKEDVYFLSFAEFREVVKTNRLDYDIILKRKKEYETYDKLTPPRVMTSEGEIISGEYRTGDLPQGALVGIPVSSGVIEGRARVVLKMEDANVEKGDILVTVFTDPSWSPLFVSLKGLVTEVGGVMTHGAVVAREYGLPAVLSVDNATKLIKDGQAVRVNGTEGYVEIL